MKITLIKANMHKRKSKDAMQPLFAAAIAAHTRADVELCLYDDRLEEIPFDEPTDLAAISIETFCAVRAYEIAAEYKKRGVKTIAGGFHPTILPEECLQYVDTVFVGDIENNWGNVINDLKSGKLKRIYRNDKLIEGAKIKFDRSIFEGKNYGPIEMVQWSRGCPHHCDFCSIKAFYNGAQIFRPIDDVIKELSNLKKKVVFFVDDNLYFNKNYFKEFLNALVPLNIKWTCQISINITLDRELVKLMSLSGCIAVLVGLESFNPNNLKLMNKQWNISNLKYNEALSILNSYGIMVYGTFIFGYDYDTKDSFQNVLSFAIKNRLFLANFNPLYPMPGTELYTRMENENRLMFKKWWLDKSFYYGKSMFVPKGMTAEELEDGCFNTKRKFNTWKSIVYRSLNPIIHYSGMQQILLYFYINWVNRKGVYMKQGIGLGK